jgi:putative DNA primase/helicase
MFVNFAKMIFAANILPRVKKAMRAFYRRVRLIELKRYFGPDTMIPKNVLVSSVTTPEELSGILNMAIEGWNRFSENNAFSGERTLDQKEEVYTKESDTVKYFADRYITPYPRALTIRKSLMYKYYCDSCRFIGKDPEPDAVFAKRLRNWVPEVDGSKRVTVEKEGEKERVYVWSGAEFNAERWNVDWRAHEGLEQSEEVEEPVPNLMGWIQPTD